MKIAKTEDVIQSLYQADKRALDTYKTLFSADMCIKRVYFQAATSLLDLLTYLPKEDWDEILIKAKMELTDYWHEEVESAKLILKELDEVIQSSSSSSSSHSSSS